MRTLLFAQSPFAVFNSNCYSALALEQACLMLISMLDGPLAEVNGLSRIAEAQSKCYATSSILESMCA